MIPSRTCPMPTISPLKDSKAPQLTWLFSLPLPPPST
jgi:hypothetical protein